MAGGIQGFNKKIIDEFRANQGKVGGQFDGMPLLLLTTKGAKSGATRTNPLAYLRDGDRYVIIASYAGAPKNPPWYHNLVADPNVRVELGGQSFDARAEVVKEPERSALYQKVEAAMPVFSEYKRKTQRVIPVIALRRTGA
ncbi:MAG TPA: nitroreductase family deazaflavin-dependent oxidoreductase [Myxococcota bacterium]|nr:nitroreductase family deazaflavin-dependent oxidoreductase [Myxococcota bacterium]